MVGGGALNLSLLSRGIGEIQQNGHEKVEVFLEPEDYFNFVKDPRRIYLPPIQAKQPFISHTSLSAREPIKLDLPKTFTTRRGALLLFSEDLAHRDNNRQKRKHGNSLAHSLDGSRSLDIKTVDDLAKSILSYGNESIDEKNDIYLGFIHNNRKKFKNERQIRPGFSAKRYLSTWTRIWDDSLLENVISKGYITERSLFYGSMAAPHLRRRIFHDDLSHYPAPYKIMRNMLISPGSLSGYTFYRMQIHEFDLVEENEDSESPTLTRQKSRPSIAVVRTRDGVQREVTYASLDKQSQKDVLTDLLVKSAVNYALQKQQEYVENLKNPSPESKGEQEHIEAFNMKEAVESLLETEKEIREFDRATQHARDSIASINSSQSSSWPDISPSKVQLPALNRQQLSTIEDVSREGTGMRVLPPITKGGVPRLNIAPPTPKDVFTDCVTQTSPDEDENWGEGTSEDIILNRACKESEQRRLLQLQIEGNKESSSSHVDGQFHFPKSQLGSDSESLGHSRNTLPVSKPLQRRQWAGSNHSLKSHSSKRGAGSVIADGSVKGSVICAPGGQIIRVGGSVAQSGSHGDVANLHEVTPQKVPPTSKSSYHLTSDSETEEPEAWKTNNTVKRSASLYGYSKSLKSSSSVEEMVPLSKEKEMEDSEQDWEKITEYPDLEGVETNRSQVVTEDNVTPSSQKSTRANSTKIIVPSSNPDAETVTPSQKDFIDPVPVRKSSAGEHFLIASDSYLENSYLTDRSDESNTRFLKNKFPRNSEAHLSIPGDIQKAPIEVPVPKVVKETIPQKIVVIETSFSEAQSSCYESSHSVNRSYREKRYTKRKKKQPITNHSEKDGNSSAQESNLLVRQPLTSLGLPSLDIRRWSNADPSQTSGRLSPLPHGTARLSARLLRSPRKEVEDLGQVALTSKGIQEIEKIERVGADSHPLTTRIRKRRKVKRRRVRKKSLPVIERRRPAAKSRSQTVSMPAGLGMNNDDEEQEEGGSPDIWEDDSSEYESEYEYFDESGEKLTNMSEKEMELCRSATPLNGDEFEFSDIRISGSGILVASRPSSGEKLSTRRSVKTNSSIVEDSSQDVVTEQGVVDALKEHAQAIAEHILGQGGGMDLEEDIKKAANLWMQTHPSRKLSRSQSVQEYRAIDAVMKAQRINSAAPTTAEYKEMIKQSISTAVANAAGVDITALALDADISDELLEALATNSLSSDEVRLVKDPLTGRSQLTTSRNSLKDGHLYSEPNGSQTDVPPVSIPSERSSVRDIGEFDVISYGASERNEVPETVRSDKSNSRSKGGQSKRSSISSVRSTKSQTEETILEQDQKEDYHDKFKAEVAVQPSEEKGQIPVSEIVIETTKNPINMYLEEPSVPVETEPPIPSTNVEVGKRTSDKGSAHSSNSSSSKNSPEKTKVKSQKLEDRDEFIVGKVKESNEIPNLYGSGEPAKRKPSLSKVVNKKPSVAGNLPPPEPTTESLTVPEQKDEEATKAIEKIKASEMKAEREKPTQPTKPEVKKDLSYQKNNKDIPKDTKYKPKSNEESPKKTKPFIPPPGKPKEKPKPAPPVKAAEVPAEVKPEAGKPKEKKTKATPAPKKEEKKKKVKKGKKTKKAEEPTAPPPREISEEKSTPPAPKPQAATVSSPPKSITPRIDSGVRTDSRNFVSPESDDMEFVIIRDRSPTPEDKPVAAEKNPPETPPKPVPEAAQEKDESEDDETKLNLISSKDARAAKRAAAAAKRREEVEKKRKEREEELKREREKAEREKQRELEAEEARRRQEEQRRLRKQQEEADRMREELESREREKKRLQELEREKRMKEERQRKFEEMKRKQAEEEQKRLELLLIKQAEEAERLRLEEEKKSQMEEQERIEYERRIREEEELRKQREALEKQRREEEAARLLEEERQKAIAEARKRAELEARLKFNRSLQLESQGFSEHSHKISEAFIFSYYEILQWLGLDIPEFELQKLEQM